MDQLPRGTVTFLFTDIEGSTRRWEDHPTAMGAVIARHDALLRGAVVRHGGAVFKTVGDAVCAAFPGAPEALAAALAAQQELAAEDWGPVGPLRVRMALHAGQAEEREGDYAGQPLNRVARLLAAGHGGQVLLSLVATELVRDHLPEGAALVDLGAHRLADLYRPERIAQLLHPALPADFPPLRALDGRPHNLPRQPTPLVGREREASNVADLLRQAEVRLVTLTGPGGVGKTRLALQVAADLLDELPDGAWFVDLSPLLDPALVPSAIAGALGVRETAGRSLAEALADHLRGKRLLLLLDNLEQVVAAAPEIARLLEAAPEVKALATSRSPLRLRGEREVAVEPLRLPARGQHVPLDLLTQYDAVRLFVDRAREARADFAVTNETAPAVAEICHRLDGLPLAIELAAARVKLFPPPVLLERMGQRLKVLTGGARDLPARQRTLRDAVAWSHDLLGEDERTLFRRLAVFAGGCTFDAVEAVCAGDGAPDPFDGLAALVDESLLRQEERDGEPRFRMLETIREYGLERLEASGEAEATRRAHAEHYRTLAAAAEPELRGAAQGEWLERLEAEHDNLRAALAWALDAGREPESALRLAGALWWFWFVRGHLAEGSAWLDRALAAAGPTAIPARATALKGSGTLAWARGEYARAQARHEEVLALAEESGDRRAVSSALHGLGLVAHAQGDLARVAALYEESLAIDRELGDDRGVAYTLHNLAIVAGEQGDLARAAALFAEGLALKRELGDGRGVAVSLQCLGEVAHRQGDPARAAAFFAESLGAFRDLGERLGVAYSLRGLAAAAAATRPEAAARLAGAAEALREAIGAPLPPDERARDDLGAAEARAGMGEAAFAATRSAGRALAWEEAVGEAQALAAELRTEAGGRGNSNPDRG